MFQLVLKLFHHLEMFYKTHLYSSKLNLFPTISITGTKCALNCKHCEGKILKTMQPATMPEQLFKICQQLKQRGASGCLISGGSQLNGSVPLNRFIPTFERIKQELKMDIHVHTGIIDESTAKALKNADIDAALIDVVGSNETIKTILNSNAIVDDYIQSLRNLHNSKVPFVPHIIAGLNNGKLKGEFEALKMIKPYSPQAIVIIALMPIRETTMATTKPPPPIEIVRVIAAARLMFPQTPIALGCMRPKGQHRSKTDVLAIKAGVSAIAFPNLTAIEYAQATGYDFNFSSYCCSQIFKDNEKRKKNN